MLWTLGVCALGYTAFVWTRASWEQAKGNREMDDVIVNARPVSIPANPAVPQPTHGDMIGRMKIPRLDLSAVVFEGTDSSVLSRGIGHLSRTAMPGAPGNVVFAAHRDTFFRSLKDIREEDEISIETSTGTRRYRVDSTEIVKPTDMDVIRNSKSPTLTLITCYPFYFVGNAPKRFIVHARDVTSPPTIEASHISPPVVEQDPPKRDLTPVIADIPRKRPVKALAKRTPLPPVIENSEEPVIQGGAMERAKRHPFRAVGRLAHKLRHFNSDE